MTHRELPREEWGLLASTELGPLLAANPPYLRVVIVEDGDAIVGYWTAIPLWHAEGLMIAPSHRGNPAVARHLLRALGDVVDAGATLTTAAAHGPDGDEVRQMLAKLNAAPFDAEMFFWTLPKRA